MYKVSTAGHNGLLVNGRGQRPHTLGSLLPYPPSQRLEGSVGDASRCYGPGVLRAQRHFLVLWQRWILVLDDVLLSRPGRVEWLCHSFERTKIQGGQARIQGQRGALSLYALNGRFGLRQHSVPMPLPGAEGVTKAPVPRTEQVLRLGAKGQRRLLLGVLLHAGPATAKAPLPGRLALEPGAKSLALHADFGRSGRFSLTWKDGRQGLYALREL
jgi:hypothetical protein